MKNLDYVRGHADCLARIEKVINDGIQRSDGAKSVQDVVDIFNAVVRETYACRTHQEKMLDDYTHSQALSYAESLKHLPFTPVLFGNFPMKGGEKK